MVVNISQKGISRGCPYNNNNNNNNNGLFSISICIHGITDLIELYNIKLFIVCI